MRGGSMIVAIGLALSAPSLLLAQARGDGRGVAPPADDRISVVVEGEGPDVILIPGLASSRAVWSGLAGRLKPGHRLHLVQVAGFAGSPAVADPDGRVAAPSAEAIADYIRRERIEAPVIVGHSVGGEVAVMLAARHPERVGRLILVDSLPFYSLVLDPAATVESMKPRATAFRDALLAAPAAQAEAMQATAIARLVKTEAARPALVAAGLRSDRRTVANATYELMTTDLRPELGRIAAPMEVVYAYDPVYGVPADRIDAIYRNAYAAAPTASFRRIDGSYHFVMLDQPDLFERAVLDFIDRKSPAPPDR